MVNVGDLLAVLRLRDELSPAVTTATASLGRLNNSAGMTSYQMTLLGRGLREAGVLATGMFTVPILGAAAAAIKFGGDFEEATTKLVSLAGVSQDELEGVRQKLLDMAPAVGVGPVALAEGMYAVSSTVSNTSVALKILESSAKLSAVGMGSVTDVSRSLTAVINSYGASNITAAHAADVLTKAVKDGGAEAKALAPLLGDVVPFAAKLGVSFEEVGANIATVTKLGIPAGEAVTQLTSVFAALTREVPRGVKALESVGWSYAKIKEEIRDPNKGLAYALIHLRQLFEGNDRGLFSVLGRLEALKNVLAVTGEQTNTYTEEVKRMYDAQGEADKVFAEASKNFKFLWQQVVSQLQAVAISLGQELLPIVKQVLTYFRDDFVPVLKTLVQWFGDLPHWAQLAVLAISGFLALLGPGLLVVGQFVLALGNMARAFGLLGAGSALGGMASVVRFLANPYVLLGAAVIGGIAAAVLTLKNNLDKMKQGPGGTSIGEPLAGLSDSTGGLKLTIENAKELNNKLGDLNTGFKVVIPSIAAFNNNTADAAAAELALLAKVAALTEEQKEQIIYYKSLGLTASQTAKEMKIGADVVGVYLRQITQSGVAARKAASDVKAYNDAWEELGSVGANIEDTLKEIDADLLITIKNFLAMGVTQSTLATAFGLTQAQIKAIALSLQKETEEIKKSERATQEYIEAWEELQSIGEDVEETIKNLDIEVVKSVKHFLEAGISQKTLATAFQLTDAQVRAIAISLRNANAESTKAAAAEKKLAEAFEELNSLGINWKETLKSIDPIIVAQVKHFLDAGVAQNVLATAFGLTDAQLKAIVKSLTKVDDGLKDLSQAFVNLSQVSDGAFGSIMRWAGQLVGAIVLVKESQAKWSAGLQNIKDKNYAQGYANMATAILGMAAAMDEATASGSKLQRTISGAATGAQIGSVWGGVGAGIGAAVGALVGFFRGMSAESKAAAEKARAIAEEITKIRTELIKTYGSIEQAVKWSNILGGSLEAALTVKGELGAKMLKNAMDDLNTKMGKLQSALEKYGLTWQDLGEDVQALKLKDTAQELYDDFNLLLMMGADTETVIRGMSGAINQFIIDAMAAGQGIPPGLQPIIEKLITMGLLTEDAARAMLGLAKDSMPSLESIKDAADRYGLTLEQLGPKVKQLQINETADQIVKDFNLLKLAGADVGVVLTAMAPQIQNMVNSALSAGYKLPAAMKPVIEEMIRLGLLTDASGDKLTDLGNLEFERPLTDAIDDLIAKLQELIDKFIAVGNTNVKPVEIPWMYKEIPGNPPPLPDEGGEPPESPEQFSSGSYGFRDFRSGTLAMLHGVERVQTLEQARAEAASTPRGTTIIKVMVPDGRVLAELTVPEIPHILSEFGVS